MPNMPAVVRFPVTYIRLLTSQPKLIAFTRIGLTINAEAEISSFVRTVSSGSSSRKTKAQCDGAKGSRLGRPPDTSARFMLLCTRYGNRSNLATRRSCDSRAPGRRRTHCRRHAHKAGSDGVQD